MSFIKKYSLVIIILLLVLVLILLLIIFTDMHVAEINRNIKQAGHLTSPRPEIINGKHI